MNRKKQNGAVLAVSLMILLMLTILTVTSNRTVLMQNKMAEATYEGQVALQFAESAIRDAETYIDNNIALIDASLFKDDGVGGFYSLDNGPADVFDSSVWVEGSGGVAVTSTSRDVQNIGLTAAYFIEDLGEMSLDSEDLSGINMSNYGQTTGGGDVNVFRIVARSGGRSGNAERIVEVFYGKRL